MRALTIISIFSLAAIMSGCAAKKKIISVTSHDSAYIQKDSVHIEYRDSLKIDTFYIPTDRAWIKALWECDSLGELRMKEIVALKSGKHVKPKIIRRGDTTIFICDVDSIAVYNIIRSRYETKHVSTQANTKVDDSSSYWQKITKWKIPWWIWVLGVIALLYLLNYFRQKIKKIF